MALQLIITKGRNTKHRDYTVMQYWLQRLWQLVPSAMEEPSTATATATAPTRGYSLKTQTHGNKFGVEEKGDKRRESEKQLV